MEHNHDIIIIGGGIIGLACAHYLAINGTDVLVIDQDKIGSGASHGNCGLLHFCGITPLCSPGVITNELPRIFFDSSPLYIKPTLDPALLSWLLKFTFNCNSKHLQHASKAKESLLKLSAFLYSEMFSANEFSCELEQKGLLLVFKEKKQFESYDAKNEWLKKFNLGGKALTREKALEMEPCLSNDIEGAWHTHHDWHLRPEALISTWKNKLAGIGVRFVENSRITDFITHGNKITRIITPEGDFNADAFVLATGAWSGQVASLLKTNIPVQPGKGYSITMNRPEPCPSIPCLLVERNMVVTPWSNGYRLGGTMEFSGFNRDLNLSRLDRLKSGAGEYLSSPLGHPVIEQWTGFRPMTSDDLPIIGQSVTLKNMYVATGHGMMGITMATGTGKAISDMILGRVPDIDMAAFSMKRF